MSPRGGDARHVVASGRRRREGRRARHGLGFPTANIRLVEGQSLGHGIYAVRVGVGAYWHGGVAYLGTRPTFDSGAPLLETFIFDFNGDLYGQKIVVEFVEFVRPDAKFRSGTDLAAQMRTDCEKAQQILEHAGSSPDAGLAV